MIRTLSQLPSWALMWGLAISILFVLKGLMWAKLGTASANAAGYWLAWPGLDPRPFRYRSAGRNEQLCKWIPSIAKCLVGLALAIGATRIWPAHPDIPLMFGVPLFLHFGIA